LSFDIDDWIPGFTFFVFILTPTVIVVYFIMLVVSRWFQNRHPTEPKMKKSFAEIIGYLPIVYLFFPLYEIAEYLYGTRASVTDRLFTVHFHYAVWLILLVGIGQVCYYFASIGKREEVGASEVMD